MSSGRPEDATAHGVVVEFHLPEFVTERVADIIGDALMDGLVGHDDVVDPAIAWTSSARLVRVTFELAGEDTTP